MYSLLKTYKKGILIALILAMIVPCTIKRDLKQMQSSELRELPFSAKTACSSVAITSVLSTENKAHLLVEPLVRSFDVPFTVSLDHQLFKEHLFLIHKEKIPTYIRLRQFRI